MPARRPVLRHAARASVGDSADSGMYAWSWSPDREVWIPCCGADALAIPRGAFAGRQLTWANATLVLWLGQTCPLPASCELCAGAAGGHRPATTGVQRTAPEAPEALVRGEPPVGAGLASVVAPGFRSERLTPQEMVYFDIELRVNSYRYRLTQMLALYDQGLARRLQRLGVDDNATLQDILSPDEFTGFICHFYEPQEEEEEEDDSDEGEEQE